MFAHRRSGSNLHWIFVKITRDQGPASNNFVRRVNCFVFLYTYFHLRAQQWLSTSFISLNSQSSDRIMPTAFMVELSTLVIAQKKVKKDSHKLMSSDLQSPRPQHIINTQPNRLSLIRCPLRTLKGQLKPPNTSPHQNVNLRADSITLTTSHYSRIVALFSSQIC